MTVRFSAGQTILRRYWTGDRITVLNALRVVADDIDGLRLWDAASGEFQGWYGNLEAAAVRWDDQVTSGFDTADHALDLWIDAVGSPAWKDLDEFEQRTGHPLYWNAAQAEEIRAAGDKLIEIAKSADFPFDGTWTDFRPNPDWPESGRPEVGWDRPRSGSGGVAGG
jgi:hypothetical protein